MKNNRTFSLFTAVIFLLLQPISSAVALDIPLLTWEKGKVQSVVLGGGSTDSSWRVLLKSSDSKFLELTGSSASAQGFTVFSISLPRDIPSGSYSIVTTGKNSPESLVAAIEVVDMKTYSITQIPGDLLFVLLAIVFWFVSLTSLRGFKFRKVKLFSSTGPKERYLAGEPTGEFIEHVYRFAPLEKIRIKIYQSFPDGFLKYLLRSDSRALHLRSPLAWSLAPLVSIAGAVSLSLVSTNKPGVNVSGVALAIFTTIVFLGTIDLLAGMSAAVTFFSINLWLTPEFSISSTLAFATESLLFFLAALASTFFIHLLKDHLTGFQRGLSYFLYEWIAPAIVVHTLFVINRSLTNAIESTFGLELILIATLWAAQQFKNLLNSSLTNQSKKTMVIEETDAEIVRVISPAFTALVLIYFQTLFYIWSNNFSISFWVALLFSLPPALLLIRPTWEKLRIFQRIRRTPIVEVVALLLISYLVVKIVLGLPILSTSSANLILGFSILPTLVYGLFSFTADYSPSIDSMESD